MDSTTRKGTRSYKDSKTKLIKSSIQQQQQRENKWVWILKESSNTSSSDTNEYYADIITLKHPCSGIGTAFLFSHTDFTLQEILSCEDQHRSWFIDESVKSDGRLKISTPIDPIFLVLPYLRKLCTNHAIPIDQLLWDEEFPNNEFLLKCSALKTLGVVADKKGSDDLEAYKYNEEKTLKWLKTKTEKVASVLEKLGIGGVVNGIASSTFIKSSRGNSSETDNSAYLKYAHGIVSEYIEPDLSEKLLHHMNLYQEPSVNLKRKSSSSNTETKKAKVEKDENVSNNAVEVKQVEVKPAKQTSKEKLRAKAAGGSKNIMSFFKKT